MNEIDYDKLREDLIDYYGTASYNGFPMAIIELTNVENASNDELINITMYAGDKEQAKNKVIIRSHGVPKRVHTIMDEKGLECVDGTCTFVKKIHRIVEKERREG